MKKMWIAIFSLIVLTACGGEESALESENDIVDPSAQNLSIWLPEWNKDNAMQDIKEFESGLKSIRLFAAQFNESDELFLTDNMKEILKEVEKLNEPHPQVLLTLTNDWVAKDSQKTISKESDLVHRLLSNKKKREAHIDEIISFVKDLPINGVEINYEQINEEDIEDYIDFLGNLYPKLEEASLEMEVVVEPSFPIETDLPDGPNYTVMAYDLYGFHSGPGPKADFDFLEELAIRIADSEQAFNIAFATDGFSWNKADEAIAVSERYAAKKSEDETASELERDPQSAALHFTYEDDETDEERTVWFADGKTLEEWMETVQAQNENITHFTLWAAGGLSEETKSWLKNK